MNLPRRIGRVVVGLGALAGGGLLGALANAIVGRRRTAPPAPPPAVPPDPTFEQSDLGARPILKIGVVFLAVLALVLIVVTLLQYWLMGYVILTGSQPPTLNPPANVTLPGEPRFEAQPGSALEQLRASENAQLNSYGWVDQASGTVHIPIQRAMDLVLQRGLPVRPEDAHKSFQSAGNQLPSSSSSGRILEQVYP